MQKKSKVFYLNMVLGLVAVLFIVSAFNPVLVKRAMAAIATITGQGTINYLSRFAGASNPSNSIGDSIIYDSGTNVGIGTAAPTRKLTLDAQNIYQSFNYNGAEKWVIGNENTAGDRFVLYNSSVGTGYVMTALTNGNVGIGTTAPNAKFEVLAPGGSVAARLGNANVNIDIGALVNGTSVGLNSSAWPIAFQTGGVTRMTIGTTGNVGIGTLTPNAPLEVSDAGSNKGIRITSGSGSAALNLYTTDGTAGNRNWAIRNRYNAFGLLEFTYGASIGADPSIVAMAINNSGNVGIGTVAPLTKLQIQQSVDSNLGGFTVTNLAATKSTFLWTDSAANNNITHLDNGGTGAGVLSLNSGGGKVGIGTTNPQATLQVNGPVMLTPLAADPTGLQNGMMWMRQ